MVMSYWQVRSDIRLHFAVADLPCVGLFTERNQMHYISFCIQFSSLLRLEIANSFIIYFYRAVILCDVTVNIL